jgi:endogenous inhibitor of DNA gyrase (YacG/DUF329 family)
MWRGPLSPQPGSRGVRPAGSHARRSEGSVPCCRRVHRVLGMNKTYPCSICGKHVGYEGPLPALYPFCSERCRLVDLGRWFSEQYSIDRDLRPEDLAGQPLPPGPPER